MACLLPGWSWRHHHRFARPQERRRCSSCPKKRDAWRGTVGSVLYVTIPNLHRSIFVFWRTQLLRLLHASRHYLNFAAAVCWTNFEKDNAFQKQLFVKKE